MIKLLRFMKPFRMALILVLVLAFVQSMANLYLPKMMADIVDNGIVKGDTGYIWSTGALMLLVTIGGVISAIIGSFFAARVATGFGKIISEWAWSRHQTISALTATGPVIRSCSTGWRRSWSGTDGNSSRCTG